MKNCIEAAAFLKNISHPQRLMIVCHLAQMEMTVGELQEQCDISQSQLSQFLGRMQREGLLMVRREGQFSYYSIKDERLIKLLKAMHRIFEKGE